uniref:glutamine synthetase n=1 Tax=viral metagenome TaxID=1070528 RepID=A0A6C0JPY6_9ZZZZ
MVTVLEYIWVGGNGELRSKTKVLYKNVTTIAEVPLWNFDGSSTDQAESTLNTEVILQPVKMYKNPFLLGFLILCETYTNDVPHATNNRHTALEIFKEKVEEESWFGLEQEYFMMKEEWDHNVPQGKYYCGIGNKSNIERIITEEHLIACLNIGLTISGLNAEVANKQWEFQIGPCEGIESADQLYIARYLLERIAERYNVTISYEPKINKYINGSGCHTNFSTKKTRDNNGLSEIWSCIHKLEQTHREHMLVYGKNNNKRLTGHHETADYNTFSYGIGTRNTSIRIGNETFKDKKGYFEDRRPAANMDPYLVTSIIFKTCCLD